MSDDIKYADISELRDLGVIQEINRQFLHPLGLALEVEIDDQTGEVHLGGVWDSRDDPEGIAYGTVAQETEGGGDGEAIWTVRREKAARFDEFQRTALTTRRASLGYEVQPLSGDR